MLARVQGFKLKVDLLQNSTKDISVKIRTLDERFRDLYNSSQVTLSKAKGVIDSNVAMKRRLDDTKVCCSGYTVYKKNFIVLLFNILSLSFPLHIMSQTPWLYILLGLNKFDEFEPDIKLN